MKVKKYVAPNMRDALEKMKRDLGTAAVILGSRKISRGGLLDFMGKEMFEVTATTEDNVLVSGRKTPAPGPARPTGSRISVTVGDEGPVKNGGNGDFTNAIRSSLSGLESSTVTRNFAAPRTADSGNVRQLQSEMKDLKDVISEMAEQIRFQKMPALPPVLKEIFRKLVETELEEKTAGELVQKIYGKFSETEYGDRTLVEKYLVEEIAGMIAVAEPTPMRTKEPLVVIFAGPSGVGKTTSLAKLATNKKFFGEKNVALVTADTYRVAATQQLGTFSEIADIPMEIAHSPRDITKAIKRHQDKDAILIDTPGGSQYNDKLLTELKDFIQAAAPDEIHLVLSVNTKPHDMQHAIKRFRTARNMRLLLTKFDETLTFGSAVTVARDSGLPVSYLTFGQEVPEDIEAANAKKIARLVLGNVF
ncbi:MAG: flagellar biosynthesis protein FlhF [Candidatus Glassbacteria bacterium]